jgi:hypothetical protein
MNVVVLKELMHQHGLNLRFLWILLTKVTLKKARELIMIAILMRVIKRVVCSKL